MVEHHKSKSPNQGIQGDGGLCTLEESMQNPNFLQNLNAARSSFLPEDEKKQLVRQLYKVYGMEE